MSLDYKHANQIITNKSNPSYMLWLGDCASAEDIEWIRANNVRVVITAASGIQLHYDKSIKHYKYNIQDIKTQNLQQYFDQVADKIHKGLNYGSVLVHCGAGVSRSATLVIAYLIKYYKMTFHEALKYTKSKRPEICPNLGFELQLKKYASMPKQPQLIGTTSQNFNKNSTNKSRTLTYFNQSQKQNISIPIISKVLPRAIRNTEPIRQRQTQPKGWRISYTLKPQFISSSVDPKSETQSYIKNLAKFRFGRTNVSKWGIY